MLQEMLTGNNGASRVERTLGLIERMERIERAINAVRYDQNLLTEIPEVLKLLGDSKEAVIAELKTL